MIHLLWWMFACTNTGSMEGNFSSLENGDHTESVDQGISDRIDELPPDINSEQTNAIMDSISGGNLTFTQFKGCYIPETSEGDAQKGRFLYAWNETDTVGLVLSIHHPPTQDLSLGKVNTLSLIERDVFIMIEIGERVSTNFCVPNIKQIPIVTVLESQTGSVQIRRTEVGLEAVIGPIVFRDQYTKREVNFKGVFIPAQEMMNPLVLE